MMKSRKLAITGILATLAILSLLLLSTACGGKSAATVTITDISPQYEPSPPDTTKPKPAVMSVTAATTGIFDSYSAIVDATIKNDGTEGVVVVVGTMTQQGTASKTELPIYMARNSTMTVRLVFPLKWRGGEWTPDVQVEIP